MLRELFRDTSIVEAKNSANWDVSVENFKRLFFRKYEYNYRLFKLGNVTSGKILKSFFSHAGNLNPDVTNWDISSNCIDISSKFL